MTTLVETSLGRWSEAWDDLVAALPLPSPFLESWWLEHTAAGTPQYVLVVDGERLLGGAAFQVRTVRGVRRVELCGQGTLDPDHLDLVSLPAEVDRVQRAVGDWLGAVASEIDFDGLLDGAALLGAVPNLRRGRLVTVAPFAELPSDPEAYLAARDGKVRSTVTRTTKRLTKAGVTVRITTEGPADEQIDTLRRLHDGRWGEHSAIPTTWKQVAAALAEGARRGRVWFAELLDAEGQPIAIEVDLVSGRRLGFYQAGRLTDHEYRGSGSMLKYAVIQHAIAAGFTEYDLLRGDEPYKQEWATGERAVVAVHSGTRLLGRAQFVGAAVTRAVRKRRLALADSRS
jgi:CelD/BcsL family acetyltransferase involved in cellulose biosynthesis